MNVPYRLLDSSHIEIGGKRHRFYVIHKAGAAIVWLDGKTYHITPERTAQPTASTGEVRALMPGKILRIDVKVGDTVNEHDTLATMESMKMESVLPAPVAGRVSEIRFKPGDVVEMGDVILSIQA